MNNDLNQLARSIHANNVSVGWWDSWPNKMDRYETAMMLVISELAEGMEGDRKSLMDTHLTQYPMFQVEIADALIRLLDLAGAVEMDFNIGEGQMNLEVYEMESRTPAEQLYRTVRAMAISRTPYFSINAGIMCCLAIAAAGDFRLRPIVEEKLAYNAQRADHKRENRAKEGGKAY